MILVAGATGFLGGEICLRLMERGQPVRGLVRATSDAASVDRLRALGVQTVVGDVRDRASMESACRDIHSVVSTVTTMRSRQPGDSIEATDEAGQFNLVDASQSAGVRRFVYVSYSGNLNDEGPLTRAKRAVEQRVRANALTYTILRPSYFMESWLSPAVGFDFANRKVTLFGSGDARLSFIALGDVAEFATRAACEFANTGGTLELGGPHPVSPLEAVRIFEEVAGQPFEVQHVPVEALRARLDAATDSLEQTFAELALHVVRGDEIPMQETLRRIPVALTSVRTYTRRVLQA